MIKFDSNELKELSNNLRGAYWAMAKAMWPILLGAMITIVLFALGVIYACKHL